MAEPEQLLADPFVAAQIDDAMALVAPALSEQERGWLREQLAEVLAEDARLVDALAGAHPRSVVHSGMQAKPFETLREDDEAAAG